MNFKPGKSYVITTEKMIELVESPWPSLLKRSCYAITTLNSFPILAKWCIPTEMPHIVMNKQGKKYLVCYLAKNVGIHGWSEFIDPQTGTVYEKREVAKWLPKQEFGDGHICVCFDSIVDATCIDQDTDLYKCLDETDRALILDAETTIDREKAVMELTGCGILEAMDLVKEYFPI